MAEQSPDLYAWMADDQNGPGVPGIVAHMGKTGSLPLVMVQEDLARRMQPVIEDLALRSGQTIRLVRFTQVAELEVVRRG